MNEKVEPTKSSTRRRILLFQLAGLIVGVVAIIPPVIIGVRSEQSKNITVHYVSKRPLVSTDSRGAGQLNVIYQGQEVQDPWLLTVRIESSGNTPIEERDIEKPLTVSFNDTKILGVEVSQVNPDNIDVSVASSGSDVVVNHKLLNPGDWIVVDVLSDGEPIASEVSFRISGISTPQVVKLNETPKITYLTGIPLGRPGDYAALTIAAITALVVFAGAVFTIGDFLKKLWFPKHVERDRASRSLDETFLHTPVDIHPWDLGKSASIILVSLGENFAISWFDSPIDLQQLIEKSIGKDLLKVFELDAESATRLLISEARLAVPRKVAHIVWTYMPSGIDDAIRREVRKIPFVDGSLKTYLSDVRTRIEQGELMDELRSETMVRDRTDIGQLIVGLVLLLVGSGTCLVVAGSWRNALGL